MKKSLTFVVLYDLIMKPHRHLREKTNAKQVIIIASSYQDYKYYHILNLINRAGPISRTEIAAITDYRSGTVGEVVKDMLDRGLVEETGRLSTGNGRSRSMLQVSSRVCAIGLSIRPTKYVVVLQPLKGEPIEQIEQSLPDTKVHESLIAQIVAVITELINRHQDLTITGIGISLPSYNPALSLQFTLSAAYQHFNDWIVIDMANALESATHMRVMTFSAVGLPAKAESLFGVAKGCRNFICIELSNGIGSSIFCNGESVTGNDNIAGQIGHTIIDYTSTGNTMCKCGKAGCMESFSAWPGLKCNILNAIRSGVSSLASPLVTEKGDKILASELRPFIDAGDQLCCYYAKRTATNIGIAIANAINLLNPERVVLYGFMLELGDYFIKQVTATIKENVLFLSRNYDIVLSESFETILPQGAAAEVMSDFLRTSDYQWVYTIAPTEIAEKQLNHSDSND